jgi:hypothetical protein
MRQLLLRVTIILSVLPGLFNCKDTGVEPDKSFTLKMDDASCTEAWLKLHLGLDITARSVTLTRDTIVLWTRTINDVEITVEDTSLLPNHTYSYTASITGQSQQCTAHTMDTTSHNFTWQTFTLGDGTGSSILYDVAIINDTLAYAVGQLYQGGTRYNFAKWNGNTWELNQIQFYTICGQPSRTPYPASSIIAFSETDIWISMDGDQVARYDGSSQTSTMCMPVSFSIKKMWGGNANSVYAVGDGGNIVHYNGSSWTKIESGTGLDIYDIYGATSSITGRNEILAVAGNRAVNFDHRILQIQGVNVSQVSDEGIPSQLVGVWFSPGITYYVVGDGIYTKYTLTDGKPWKGIHSGLTTYYTNTVRGIAVNNIFIAGVAGTLLHFNGRSWRSYISSTGLSNGAYTSVAIRNNLVIAVGGNGPLAVITKGVRIP